MTALATPPPNSRADLVIQPMGEGRYVVKTTGTQDYFQLGEQERFLLALLDGAQEAPEICAAFEREFAEPLNEEDFKCFIEMARENGLLENPDSQSSRAGEPKGEFARRPQQSILYWRKSLFDPDRLFNWLEPRIRLVWTSGFLVVSASSIALAALIMWTSRIPAANSLADALRWETVILAWLLMLAVGMLHEFAHGLTCKHYGGEVREIGFLLMYFMPCYYCNVSDAWLFREKSKRLQVTFAGGYFELGLWALAVFVWRITMPDTLINYLAFIVVVACGIETFLNFNPLIKLDGYYLLSDWMEIPNLRQRSFTHLMSWGRRLLWGGPRPEAQMRGRSLLVFGLASWVYSLVFLVLMLIFMRAWLNQWLGWLGLPVVTVLGLVSMRGLVGDLFREEFVKMFWHRHRRTAIWAVALTGIVAGSFLVSWRDHVGGDFEIRAKTHMELRAPVAGFLRKVHHDEGDHVSPGCEIAQLTILDLASRVSRKEAELREAQAELRLLQAGPRVEEIQQQRRRAEAAQTWRDVAARNLQQQKLAAEQELIQFDHLLQELAAECDYAQDVLSRYEKLRGNNAISEAEYTAAKKSQLVARAKRRQTEAERQSRAIRGTLAAESELAERDTELAREQAILAVLLAGTRPEKVVAAEASVERIREELSYLHELTARLSIRSHVGGVITTCNLRTKIGDYFDEGELICEVEDAGQLEIVIALDEDQAARIQPGQNVRLKARSLPFETFEVEVRRIAPRAAKGDVQSKVNVYCSLDDPEHNLRSGTTGYARVECRRAPIAIVLSEKCLRFLRTEFWW